MENDLTQFVTDYPVTKDNIKDCKEFLRYLGKQSLVDKKFNDYIKIFIGKMVAFGFDEHYALRLATSTFSVATCYKYQSLDTLIADISEGGGGCDVIGGDVHADIEHKEYKEKFDDIISKFSKIQFTYYELLSEGYEPEDIAVKLNKSLKSVYKMKNIIEEKLEIFRDFLIDEISKNQKNNIVNSENNSL